MEMGLTWTHFKDERWSSRVAKWKGPVRKRRREREMINGIWRRYRIDNVNEIRDKPSGLRL